MTMCVRLALLVFGCMALAFCTSLPPVTIIATAPERHPAYLHALSDLRTARWLLEHVPGDWVRANDEINAVKKIDDAINEIKKAAIDDGKAINDHVAVDEKPDHPGRLHDAADLLRKARADINQEADTPITQGLQNRAGQHIDGAIAFVENAIKAVSN